ncbi:fimbria/pilus outer membrane usher protein [Enterobacter kobei]|uniref:fimbria/pilus outer membrane usher protein n=1 Tax=Enterobacter kobei TaxID=208224 RepID=UPI00300D4B16
MKKLVVRISPVALAVIFASYGYAESDPSSSDNRYARNVVEFESDFLRLEGYNRIDLRRFSYGSSASPGKYPVSVYVNGNEIASEEVEFREAKDGYVYPCLSPRLVQLINFREERLTADMKSALSSPSGCADLQNVIPDSKIDFDSGEQKLSIEVPQIYVNRIARGSVSPELWDSGVPALMLGYYINNYESRYKNGQSSSSLYASVNSGLNIGAWYFRHNGSWNKQKGQGGRYQALNTYVQRDIAPVRGRVVLGEYNTTGQLFNSVPFTGVQLASDERMLPDSQRGFAPEIRGVARTNAKVTVRQQGNIIYETTVTPGAFLINDLYPTGYGGDLEVTIQEADGSIQQYTMPYASVAQLLRPGSHRYSATAGKLRDVGLSEKPAFYELTYQRGLNNTFTGYGGVQVSQNYRAGQVGLAAGTRLGALGIDVTQSESRLGEKAGGRLSGQSYRVSYSKLINETNSNITLAGYRFSSSGYMDFLTAMQTREAARRDERQFSIRRSKNRYTATVSQGLPDGWGNLYVSASAENYWNSQEGYNTQYQAGYSNTYKRLSYGLSVSRNRSSNGSEQTSWFLNFSLPLWEDRSARSPTLSLRYNQNSNGGKGQQMTLSGVAGEENQYSYNLSAAHDNYSGTSGSVSGTWQNRVTQMTGSYGEGKNYRSTSVGMSGGVVVHSGGVTLTPYNSDSYALIEAKDAKGAKVAGYAGASIDSFGYALFPSLMPYQMNSVSIDPEGASQDVEFENTSQRVAPRAGAVVKVKFRTNSGTPVLIKSNFGGEPLPFGAEVYDENNRNVGTVTQGSVIYARTQEQRGAFTIKWGSGIFEQCRVSYILAPVKTQMPQRFESECVSSAKAPQGNTKFAFN